MKLKMVLLFACVFFAVGCEKDTVLDIQTGNPPKFVMSGNGRFDTLMITGPKTQREAIGEDASVYWRIRRLPHTSTSVKDVGTVVYGKVPENFLQVYPERGDAPPLEEGDRYYIRIDTSNANGAEKYFSIVNGDIQQRDVQPKVRP